MQYKRRIIFFFKIEHLNTNFFYGSIKIKEPLFVKTNVPLNVSKFMNVVELFIGLKAGVENKVEFSKTVIFPVIDEVIVSKDIVLLKKVSIVFWGVFVILVGLIVDDVLVKLL